MGKNTKKAKIYKTLNSHGYQDINIIIGKRENGFFLKISLHLLLHVYICV